MWLRLRGRPARGWTAAMVHGGMRERLDEAALLPAHENPLLGQDILEEVPAREILHQLLVGVGLEARQLADRKSVV